MKSILEKMRLFAKKEVKQEESKKNDATREITNNNENKQEVATNEITTESVCNSNEENVMQTIEKKDITSQKQPERKIVKVCKMGADHNFANKNNHDFTFHILNMKVVTDGCGSGKHSEVGTRIFAQLFARKAKEYLDKDEAICEENFIQVVDSIFTKMLELCDDISFIFQNYCFTILICFELEDEFVVYSCGDGYIIKEDKDGIVFEELDDGEYPCYYVYNYVKDKSALQEYKEGVTFKISRFSKNDYLNVGVASDGLRFADNLLDVEKNKLLQFLHEGKGPQIEKLINRNNIARNGMFHDDISICF